MNYFQNTLKEFQAETFNTNASWRILRIDTLIDLILLELYKYIKTNDKTVKA